MKQKTTSHRRAIGLLLAAAALPLNPALAQDVTPAPATPPVVDATPAPAEAPVIAPAAPPAAVAPAPVAAPPPAAEPATEASTRPTRARTSPAPSRTPPARTASPAPARAPVAVATSPAPAPATAPLAASPATDPSTAAPAPEATAETSTATAAPAQPSPASRPSIWPWLLGALVLIGAAALLLRRRRRDEDVYYEEAIEEPEVVAAPVMGRPLAEERIAPATMTAAVADETVAPPAMAPEVAAASLAPAAEPEVESGSPALAIEMRPVRAGVNADDAVVEFELTVDNCGDAAARDVRISTWMFPAGHASEAERALIEGGSDADLPSVTIASGDAKRIETAVSLPTANISEDSVLPVVVAEASYRLPDGSEGHTVASFEVGVPVDGELAHFDVENPSGLHEDVVARPYREAIEA